MSTLCLTRGSEIVGSVTSTIDYQFRVQSLPPFDSNCFAIAVSRQQHLHLPGIVSCHEFEGETHQTTFTEHETELACMTQARRGTARWFSLARYPLLEAPAAGSASERKISSIWVGLRRLRRSKRHNRSFADGRRSHFGCFRSHQPIPSPE